MERGSPGAGAGHRGALWRAGEDVDGASGGADGEPQEPVCEGRRAPASARAGRGPAGVRALVRTQRPRRGMVSGAGPRGPGWVTPKPPGVPGQVPGGGRPRVGPMHVLGGGSRGPGGSHNFRSSLVAASGSEPENVGRPGTRPPSSKLPPPRTQEGKGRVSALPLKPPSFLCSRVGSLGARRLDAAELSSNCSITRGTR